MTFFSRLLIIANHPLHLSTRLLVQCSCKFTGRNVYNFIPVSYPLDGVTQGGLLPPLTPLRVSLSEDVKGTKFSPGRQKYVQNWLILFVLALMFNSSRCKLNALFSNNHLFYEVQEEHVASLSIALKPVSYEYGIIGMHDYQPMTVHWHTRVHCHWLFIGY